MIKQFNFYDIYGYLLPGMLLLGIFWLPIGVLTKSWPDQDLSKALFLAGLAYILGHLVQSVAASLVPSKVRDSAQHLRAPSDLFLDPGYRSPLSGSYLGETFKQRLADQVNERFALSLSLLENGDGKNEISANRNDAFYQARSYLIFKKAANYVEQFEGLYAMMRGLGCSLCAGAAYLAGWALAFHRDHVYVYAPMAVLSTIALSGTFLTIWRVKVTDRYLWLSVFFGAGFWVSFTQPKDLWAQAPTYLEFMFWVSFLIALIAAAKCFSSYKRFAEIFAQTVWRDFSACLSSQEAPAQPPEASRPSSDDAPDED